MADTHTDTSINSFNPSVAHKYPAAKNNYKAKLRNWYKGWVICHSWYSNMLLMWVMWYMYQ